MASNDAQPLVLWYNQLGMHDVDRVGGKNAGPLARQILDYILLPNHGLVEGATTITTTDTPISE